MSEDPFPDDENTQSQDAPEKARPRTLGLGGFVVELILPTVLSGAALLAAARYLPWWNLRGRVGIWSFGLLLLISSLILSIWIDSRTLAGRRRDGKSRTLNRADARSRLVKFILGGIALPLGLFVAANLVKLPDRRTPMAVAAQLTERPPDVSREEQIGAAVLGARQSAVKVAGIAALEAARSQGGLDQLFRILSRDPAMARGGTESQALSKALAAYGKLAAPRLIERLSAAVQDLPALPLSGVDDFDLYVDPGFEALRNDMAARSLDPARKAEALALLQEAAAESKRRLAAAIPADESRSARSGIAHLVLGTFLSMSPGEADLVLPVARKMAADESGAPGLRGQALLLVGRLGGKDDLDLLYQQLGSPSPLVQARALQAIPILAARSGQAGGK
jgi:hypothetical protein